MSYDEAALAAVKQTLIDVLHIAEERITPEARLREDLEMDSLDMVEVITHVEDDLGHSVDEEFLTDVQSVGDVAALVSKLAAEHGVDLTSKVLS